MELVYYNLKKAHIPSLRGQYL